MTFPMVNPKPMGWALFETLTSAQATQINSNAAAAADGALWSDVAMSNFIVQGSNSPNGAIIGWDPASRHFYTFGGLTEGKRTRTGRNYFTLTVPDGLDASANSRHAFAANGLGTILIGGGSVNGATSYGRSTDGTTWALLSTSAAANFLCRAIRFVPFLNGGSGAFVSAFSNGAIETSPTGAAGTWTNQTVPDAQDRTGGIADNGSIIVVGCAGTPNFITSTNGTSWTQRTGALSAAFSVVWSPYWGKFFSYTSIDVQSSADGITWSAAGLSLPGGGITSFQTFPLCQYGRLLFMLGNSGTNAMLAYSWDGAETWAIADDMSTGSLGLNLHVAPHGQILVTDAGNTHYASIRGGG